MKRVISIILIVLTFSLLSSCKTRSEKIHEEASIAAEKAEKSRKELQELESLYDEYKEAYSNYIGN